jgi:hypothetical protein
VSSQAGWQADGGDVVVHVFTAACNAVATSSNNAPSYV